MSDVVVVAIVTGLAATVPQILTWIQNQGRDKWERTNAAAIQQRATEDREADAEAAAVSARRIAYSACLDTAATLIADYRPQSTTPNLTLLQDAAELLKAWTDALFDASHATRPTIESLLTTLGQHDLDRDTLVGALIVHRKRLIEAIRDDANPNTVVTGAAYTRMP